MTDSSKKANSYLKAESHDLRLVFAKIRELTILNEKVAQYLDPSVVKYCQVANVVGPKLVLLAANGSIATQLRFQLPDLLKKLKADPHPTLQKIQDIQCKVHPTFLPNRQPVVSKNKQPMQKPSPETARMMHELAESIDDPKLKEVMRRIAGHGDGAEE